jgi:fermentation-respiration switch protein FrsA (DUF1100 family)
MRHHSGRDPDKSAHMEIIPVLGKILAGLTVLYLLLAVGAHFLSRSIMYPRPPVKYLLGPDYIELKAPDGTRVVARHWPNPAARHTLLYLHGNYEDLGRLAEYIPGFVEAGYAVFAFDYRGYGQSEGMPNEANLNSDTRLAYDHLRTKLGVPAGQIVLFGYSLGSGPAVELALQQPTAGLVLQGPFISAYRVMTGIPVFVGDKFVNIRKAPLLRCPVMVIHGSADDTVPFSHGEKLFAAVTARKAKLFVQDGPHGGLADFTGPRYWEELKKFTDSL